MSPMRDGTTSKDRATQLLICEPLSFAIRMSRMSRGSHGSKESESFMHVTHVTYVTWHAWHAFFLFYWYSIRMSRMSHMSRGSHGSNESEICMSRMSRMSRDMRDMRDMQLSDTQYACHACHTCHVGHMGQIISPQISCHACHACHRDFVLELKKKQQKTMSQVHVTHACHIWQFWTLSWATYALTTYPVSQSQIIYFHSNTSMQIWRLLRFFYIFCCFNFPVSNLANMSKVPNIGNVYQLKHNYEMSWALVYSQAYFFYIICKNWFFALGYITSYFTQSAH